MLGTLEKASLVLELFTPQRPEWGVTELARTLNMPPSSTHLLVSSLAGLGLLHRTAAGRYRLGFRLLALTRVLLENTPWRDIARSEMTLLHRQLGETVILTALDGGALIRVDALTGTQPGSIPPLALGQTPPVHATASGKVLAAFRPAEVTVATRLPAFTPATHTDADELAAELVGVRERGLAFSLGEFRAGVCSVAAPVFNHNAEVIAALSLSVPETRFGPRQTEFMAGVRGSAGRISAQIGYEPPRAGDTLLWASVAGRDELRPVRQVGRKGKGRTA